MVKLTDAEMAAEWLYRFEERLSMLAGTDDPTPEQRAQAADDADMAIYELRAGPKFIKDVIPQ